MPVMVRASCGKPVEQSWGCNTWLGASWRAERRSLNLRSVFEQRCVSGLSLERSSASGLAFASLLFMHMRGVAHHDV